ncbi:reverse transcriptase domain-containing protein [Tanacetum coccineum]
MADNRTMAQMLQAPIEGYEDAIVIPPINANNFELKQPLINLVQSNKFTGRQDPHNHLRFFNKVTSTFRHPEVPNTSVKLLLFPFSLDGEARDWLDKEPPRSILTWDDLVSKFINQYFPPSKTTYYRNEIITFYQKPNEAFNEAWERFKGLLRQCPHHGFSELHQLDTFYNSLNSNDQDALDSAAGGNFLDKMPQEGLAIIESKSKVRYSRSRANDSRVSTDAPLSNSSSSNNSFDMQQIAASLEDKMTIKMNQMMSQMKALVVTPAPVKAVEEVCVTCGSNHNFNNCPLTRSGNDFPVFQDNIQQFQQTAAIESNGLMLQVLTSLCDNFKNSASTSNSGTLPSQTVTNPRQQINAITTRSGKTLEEPSIPLVPTPDVSKPQKEPEQNPETSTEKVQNPELENTAHIPPPGEEDSIFMEIPNPKAKKTINVEIQDLNSPNPNSNQSRLPYPERMKVREHDKPIQQMVKLVAKEQREARGDRHYNQLKRTSALADSGASINLLPYSIYKKLELEALTPTRMTLELANRSISHPMGIAEDVVVRVDGFTFLADFVFFSGETSDNFVKIADELAPLDSLPPASLSTLLYSRQGCVFCSEDDNDEIDDFLAIEVSSNLEEGYFDSEGDIAFLDNLLMLNEISTSQGNFHQNSVIESLPMSPILVEDSDPTQEEIDILLVPDNLIPPGVEDADSEANHPNGDCQSQIDLFITFTLTIQ